jgi:hypothetical protein
MADWRQIQARIRKAKNSPDASSKLSELYQRTRDAMVAWELGTIEEKAGRNEEAGRWYIISAQRFRRADWKKKAQEALDRLGIELPAPGVELAPTPAPTPTPTRSRSEAGEETESTEQIPVLGEISDLSVDANGDTANGSAAEADTAASASTQDGAKKKRRRGRRGGRGRHRKGAAAATPGLPSKAFAASVAPSESRLPSPRVDARSETRVETHFDPRLERPEFHAEEAPSESNSAEAQRTSAPISSSVRRSSAEHAAPMLPSERTAHGRAGDPALASRLSRLESMLRRLVSSPLHNLDQAEEAPAGPGVFLLSDSDQITSYYVEACQTLRVGIGNLVRGSRGSKAPRGSGRGYPDTSGLKAKLAEHLEINEAKVSQYLKDHCVIRWIQLDDDAPMLAHFAIAVLRTPLNIE